MKSAIFIFVAINFGPITADQNCDKDGILLYEDLACTPTHVSENKCPTKFTCDHLGPSDTHCYFRGKAYKRGEKINDSLTYPDCELRCRCSIQNEWKGYICAALDCVEAIGPPVKKDCYRTYELNGCCSVGEMCPPFDAIQKCTVEGKEYKEGEEFWPSNTCLACVCQKGFEGKFVEPFCKRRTCGEQLRSGRYTPIEQRCAPFYQKAEVLCCPDNYICPDNTEEIKGEAKSDEICHFGNKTLKVGQHFDKSNHVGRFGEKFRKVHCECVIPPLVKCENV